MQRKKKVNSDDRKQSKKRQNIILLEGKLIVLPEVCHGCWSFPKYTYACSLYTTLYAA